MFRALEGQRIPGGCLDCDAYQTVREATPGVYIVTVHHDDTCPRYTTMTEGTSE